MGEVYEFDGQMFESTGEFLDALAHEYKTGDKEAAVDALENYGFSISDLNVSP